MVDITAVCDKNWVYLRFLHKDGGCLGAAVLTPDEATTLGQDLMHAADQARLDA